MKVQRKIKGKKMIRLGKEDYYIQSGARDEHSIRFKTDVRITEVTEKSVVFSNGVSLNIFLNEYNGDFEGYTENYNGSSHLPQFTELKDTELYNQELSWLIVAPYKFGIRVSGFKFLKDYFNYLVFLRAKNDDELFKSFSVELRDKNDYVVLFEVNVGDHDPYYDRE